MFDFDKILVSFTTKQKREFLQTLDVKKGLTADGFETLSIYLKNGSILTMRFKDIFNFLKKS